ncbi:MAG: restriction endonuclease subunit S [Pyrinomonadaceae bacterium]|nr:restriction endonuclease subunit S [Sphingobacteriaceae bacterium]
MKTLTVKRKWFEESDLRLDAEFHLSYGPMAKRIMDNSPLNITTLRQASERIFMGNIFKRTYVNNSEFGLPYLTASDMVKSNIDTGKYISEKYTTQKANLEIKEGWILVSRSGTLGMTVFTNKDFAGRIGTDDLIRIIPNDNKIKPGFLYAYLTSKYGNALLTQASYGGVIKHIEPHHIQDLSIPIFPEHQQNKIHQLITQAAELRVEANKLLQDALQFIDTQFDFFTPKKIYTVNIKAIRSGDKFTQETRLEADFYQPLTDKISDQIKRNGKYDLLGNLCHTVSISNLRGRIFVSKGFVLFTGQSLGLLKPDISKQLSKKLTKNIEENTTRDGDVLVSAFGTLGKTEFCYKNFYSGVFASQQLVRIRTDRDKIHPGYIYLFLKSRVGQLLIQKYKTGSVIEWANWNNFSSILIPIPNDKGLQLGQQAEEIALNFQFAYEKENQAIQLIENEIESWQN